MLSETHEKELERDPVGLGTLFRTTLENIETRLELLKLTVLEKIALTAANLITFAIIGVLGLLFLLFGLVGVALAIGQAMNHNYAAGFGIVAGVMLVAALVLFLTRKSFLGATFENMMITSLFAENEDDNGPKIDH